MKDVALIEALADGRFHSGEALGAVLGISRAAVWKRLQPLADLGLEIERVRGKGYRIAGGLSLLDSERILQAAALSADAVDLQLKLETGSTNVDALYAARASLQRPVAVLAEYQSAGRGRRGRAWVSPFAASLYLSLAVEFAGGASRLEGLSLAVGVVVAELLDAQGVSDVALKWPNDILVRGRKLGGILIELSGDLDANCRAVIGVGLNGMLPETVQVDQPVTDLRRELGQAPDRNLWAGQLLRRLLDMSEEFASLGFAAFHQRWQRYDATANQPVDIWQGDTPVSGVALGVTERGALKVRTGAGIEEYHGGEVTVRRTAT